MKSGIAFLIVLMTALVAGCGKDTETKTEEKIEEQPAENTSVTLDANKQSEAGIVTEEVRTKQLPQTLTVPGRIEFDQRRLAHLTSRVAGRVEAVNAFLGDRVRANQLLATIYSQEYLTTQAEFVQAEERLRLARTRSDSAELKTAASIFESVKRKLLVIGATESELEELAQSHIPKTLLEIRSPLTGTVTEAGEILGHFVDVGTNLFHIADITSVWATIDIYEKDIQKVRAGMKVDAEVAAYPGEVFPGVLTRVFDVVDEKTRTIKGRVEFQNPAGKLKPDMFATVRLKAETSTPVVVLPEAALLMEGSTRYVFVATSETTFQKRLVKVGEETAQNIPILEGLAPRERVVTKGAFTLKAEMLKSTFGEE